MDYVVVQAVQGEPRRVTDNNKRLSAAIISPGVREDKVEERMEEN